jgi:hypothetical protein
MHVLNIPRVFSRDFLGPYVNQILNLELSFETQSSHQSFSAVKMKLFELNFVTCGNKCSVGNPTVKKKMAGIHLTTQEKLCIRPGAHIRGVWVWGM